MTVVKKKTSRGTTAAMVTPHVRVASKPEHIGDLRATWRKTREHYRAQAFRFARIFLTVLAPQVFALGADHLTRSAVIALIPGALEVAWRQFRPALTASQVDSAPGATIVPNEVAGDDGEDEDGHADLLLVAGVTLAVFLGLLLYHAVIT